MGLKIRINGIYSPNRFKIYFKTGASAGNDAIIATGYTQYTVGADQPNGVYENSTSRNYNSNPIIFTGASFDTQYWFKLVDTVTGGYIIENIYTNQAEVYDECINCCLFSGGSATFIATPTPTPGPSPTPTPTSDCTFTGGSATYDNNPTPTATAVPPTATPVPPTPTSIPPTPTPIPPTPTPTSVPIIAGASGSMEPCIGGTIDDYMGASVNLTAPVTVDTLFDVTVWYTQPGSPCSYPNITNGAYGQSFQVFVAAGEQGGYVNACTNGYYFASGANICGACVTGSDNTVDPITYSNPTGC